MITESLGYFLLELENWIVWKPWLNIILYRIYYVVVFLPHWRTKIQYNLNLFYPYFLCCYPSFGILCRKWEYFESFLYIIPFIMHALFVCKCGTRISMVVFFPACILQKRRYAHLKATVFNAQAYQHFYKRPTDDEGIVQSLFLRRSLIISKGS